jgi:glycosyltransferase involved in cell wall biosynthesis
MKVLHICTEKSWRGGENQIRLLIEGSRALGVENFVAVPAGGRSFDKFSSFVKTLSLASKGGSNPISIWRLVQFCRAEGIEIVDAQGSGGLSLALWVKKFVPSIKVVAHRRVDIAVAKDFFSRRKYLSPHIAHFVAISQKIKKTLIECGVVGDQVSVVPSAVDSKVYSHIDAAAERAKLLKRFNLSDNTVLVGNASALVPTKGNQFLIFALPEVLKKIERPIHVLLAGEGEQRAELEAFVREAGLQDRVTFLGHIDAVPNFLAGLDVMVMPTMSEGLGTIILDAICAGTVVMASDVGGVPEIIVHGETGLLFPVGDVEALKINLIRLIEDQALRTRLNGQAAKHVAQNFSLESMIQGNVAIYKALMDKLPD